MVQITDDMKARAAAAFAKPKTNEAGYTHTDMPVTVNVVRTDEAGQAHVDLPNGGRRRGRPVTGTAMTAYERLKKHRAKKKEQ